MLLHQGARSGTEQIGYDSECLPLGIVAMTKRLKLNRVFMVAAISIAVALPAHSDTVMFKATGRVTAMHESKSPYLYNVDIGSLIALTFTIVKSVGDVDAEPGLARYPNITGVATCMGGRYSNFTQNIDTHEWRNGTWIFDDHVETYESLYRDSFSLFAAQHSREPGLEEYRIEASVRLLDKLRTKQKGGPLNSEAMPATPPKLSGFRMQRVGRIQWMWDKKAPSAPFPKEDRKIYTDWVEFEVTKLEIPGTGDDGCPRP